MRDRAPSALVAKPVLAATIVPRAARRLRPDDDGAACAESLAAVS